MQRGARTGFSEPSINSVKKLRNYLVYGKHTKMPRKFVISENVVVESLNIPTKSYTGVIQK